MAQERDGSPLESTIPPPSPSAHPPGSPEGLQDDDAVFLGWQKVGGKEALPLYNITASGHPLAGSTVTDLKLRILNLRIPLTPPRRE